MPQKTMRIITLCNARIQIIPHRKVRGANVGPTWVLSVPGGPHVGHMNFAIWDVDISDFCYQLCTNKIDNSL